MKLWRKLFGVIISVAILLEGTVSDSVKPERDKEDSQQIYDPDELADDEEDLDMEYFGKYILEDEDYELIDGEMGEQYIYQYFHGADIVEEPTPQTEMSKETDRDSQLAGTEQQIVKDHHEDELDLEEEQIVDLDQEQGLDGSLQGEELQDEGLDQEAPDYQTSQPINEEQSQDATEQEDQGEVHILDDEQLEIDEETDEESQEELDPGLDEQLDEEQHFEDVSQEQYQEGIIEQLEDEDLADF